MHDKNGHIRLQERSLYPTHSISLSINDRHCVM